MKMKRKKLHGIEDFDAAFDSGEIAIDFRDGTIGVRNNRGQEQSGSGLS